MATEKHVIKLDEILKDSEAKKQIVDLLLDTSDDDCEIKIDGRTYKVSLDVNLSSVH